MLVKQAIWATLLLAAALPAHAGLIFNNTFDSSLNANLSPGDVTNWENDIEYVEGVYSELFSNSITINLTFQAAPGTSILGESNTELLCCLNYVDTANALASHATSPDQLTSVANLPASDPTGGGNFWFPVAEARALGLYPATDGTPDGTITFGAGFTYAYDPSNRAVPGEFDFIGVAAHEISEAMGRIGLQATTALNGSPAYDVLDLFGYTAPGDLSLDGTASSVYFSIDGGVTNLMDYNDPGNGGDLKDWAGGSNDSYNAFTGPGVENGISSVDIEEMNVIGYDVNAPEPGTIMLMTFALGLVGFFRRRRLLRGY